MRSSLGIAALGLMACSSSARSTGAPPAKVCHESIEARAAGAYGPAEAARGDPAHAEARRDGHARYAEPCQAACNNDDRDACVETMLLQMDGAPEWNPWSVVTLETLCNNGKPLACQYLEARPGLLAQATGETDASLAAERASRPPATSSDPGGSSSGAGGTSSGGTADLDDGIQRVIAQAQSEGFALIHDERVISGAGNWSVRLDNLLSPGADNLLVVVVAAGTRASALVSAADHDTKYLERLDLGAFTALRVNLGVDTYTLEYRPKVVVESDGPAHLVVMRR